MPLVITKYTGPDEVMVELDGGRFFFSRFRFTEIENLAGADYVKQVEYLSKKFLRAEDITDQDGNPVSFNKDWFVDLGPTLVGRLVNSFIEVNKPYIERDENLKKALQASA